MKYKTYEEALAAVKEDGRNLQYIEGPTEELCVAAIMQNPLAPTMICCSVLGFVPI